MKIHYSIKGVISMEEKTRKIRLSEYADLMTVTRQTALNWYHQGKIPFPTFRPSERIILVEVPESFTGISSYEGNNDDFTVAYCRVSTSKQKESLPLQKLAIYEYANENGLSIDKCIEEVGSGFNENRKKLSSILADPSISTIIVEHRERLARSNFNLIKKTLNAQGRDIIVVSDNDVEGDLVTEITEFMVSACGELYGKRGAERVKNILKEESKGEAHEK